MEIGGGSGGGVRVETHNLRDLLRVKEEEHVNNRNQSSTSSQSSHGSGGLTLLALFSAAPERSVNSSSRTLYEIIREERMSSEGGNSWRQLTEKIRRYQGGRNLSDDEAVVGGNNPRQEEETETRGIVVDRNRSEDPARRSLMTLLTENDRQFMVEEEAVEEELNNNNNNCCCCVCMVRQKGAAFIPCGHTFCRQCSRELWVHRGNCPICNKLILQILDIF